MAEKDIQLKHKINGEIVDLNPLTKAGNVSYGDTTVSAAISSLESASDDFDDRIGEIEVECVTSGYIDDNGHLNLVTGIA